MTTRVRVRALEPSDLDAVVAIESTSWVAARCRLTMSRSNGLAIFQTRGGASVLRCRANCAFSTQSN